MTKQQLWAAYCKRYPKFTEPDAEITMTARGLRKLFDQTWDHAAKAKQASSSQSEFDPFGELFRRYRS